MNLVMTIIQTELSIKPKRLILATLFNIIGTVLFYTVLAKGFGLLNLQNQMAPMPESLFTGIIGLIAAWTAFELPTMRTWTLVSHTGIIDLLRMGRYHFWQLYLGKSIAYWIEVQYHIIIASLVLYALIGFSIHPVFLPLYWIYLMAGSIFLVHLGFLCGVLITHGEWHCYIWLWLLTPIVLMSGVMTMPSLLDGWFKYVVLALPTTALIAGGRSLVVSQSLNLIWVLQLVAADILFGMFSYYFIRRKLQQ